MLRPAGVARCLLLVLLAGCAGEPRRNTIHSPKWENAGSSMASVVAPAPSLAAPASTVTGTLGVGNYDRPAAGGAVMSSGPVTNRSDGRPAAPAVPGEFSGPGWVPLQRWCRTSGVASLSRLTSSGPAAYMLRSAQGALVLHPGTLAAQWEGLELRLGFAPQLIDEQPYVQALDLNKTLLPLLNGRGGSSFGEPIVVDAGHGGEDAGARGLLGGCKEKDLTLDWALRLRRSLSAKGFNVLLTRSTDTNIPLAERVAAATAAHAGVFISLHFNSAAPARSEAGLETYCLTPAGMPSSLTRNYADDIGQAFPNNGFDAENLRLAVQIHRALLQVNGHQDRGVRRARFPAVLRGQQCPAVLIEGGYLSNPAEAQAITDAGYRQELAEAVARGLGEYLGPKLKQ